MAKSMKIPFEECKVVLEDFYKNFPKIKEFGDKNVRDVTEKGYVEDYMGRRRHLPDASLPEIEITQKKKVPTNCGVFFGNDGKDGFVEIPDEEVIAEWTEKWKTYEQSGRFNAKKDFKKLAKDCGISVYDNGAFIAKTRTQCTNARIQGSAASLTKKAMVSIFNDDEMNKLGFRLLIPVHDELLGECPLENAERVSRHLTELMVGATRPEVTIKFKCDPYVAKHWYADEVANEIYNDFYQLTNPSKLNDGNPMSKEDAVEKLCEDYEELNRETVINMCNGDFDMTSEVV